MSSILQDLRRALEHEIALGGPFVPLEASAAGPGAVSTLRADRPADAADVPQTAVAALSAPPGPDDSADMKDLFGNKKPLSEDPTASPYERIEALISADNPIRSMKSLEEVRDYLATHELIDLDKSRINPVFGVGDPEANLIVIGEAPGADEDRAGEPFVGRAGQLLNKILGAVNFDRDEVYITNILKSRPPGNRDPQPEEIAGHLPALYKQIALIQPKIILCVGKTAGNAMLGRRSSLAALRDKVHDFHGLPLVVTYHPAALLRNEQWKRPTWEDVKLLRTKYDQLVGGKT